MNNWINTNEWTPQPYLSVLVCNVGLQPPITHSLFVAFIDCEGVWYTQEDSECCREAYELKNVTHWTLLPKMPFIKDSITNED